jgi:hypothetical protein
MVAYICHSSYSGGRSRNSTHSRPTLVKFRQKLRDSISKIKYKTKGLKVWLKQYSICLSCMRPWAQSPEQGKNDDDNNECHGWNNLVSFF